MFTVTVFTPTYNRAALLTRLYNSLVNQSNKDFMWLIVDDGSVDNTKEVVKDFISQEKIVIRYVRQKNSGKHAAHNIGVMLSETELFVCVDSDDSLSEDAVEEIIRIWQQVDDKNICGIIGPRSNSRLDLWPKKAQNGTLMELYEKYGFLGDTIIIFRTDIIKRYYFPVFRGERFLAESVIYEEIDSDFKYIYTSKVLYVGQYQKDGLTANITALQKSNPVGTAYTFKHTAAFHTNWLKRMKSYGAYLGMKHLYNLDDSFRNVNVDIITRIGGYCLKRHYVKLLQRG